MTGPTDPASAPLAVRVLPGAARDEARALWQQLERGLAGLTPPQPPALSCSWLWTGTWLEQYGDVVAHDFLVAERDGRVAGIALVTLAPSAGPLRQRTLHLGTAGEPLGASVFVERNRLLVADADRAAFAAAVVAHVAARHDWDRLRLDGLHAEDAALLLAALTAAGLAPAVEEQDSPIADLQEGDDVLAGLSSSKRQRARRSLKAFGELETEWAREPAQAQAILDELIALHDARWHAEGAEGAFSNPRFVAFHRALIAALLEQDGVALVRVRRGEETVGCLYGLVEGDRLLFYQSGLRQFEDNKLRAGVAGHVCFMTACRERGLTTYDFLAPAARYKQDLSSRADRLVWAEVERPTWRTRATHAARRARSFRSRR